VAELNVFQREIKTIAELQSKTPDLEYFYPVNHIQTGQTVICYL